MARWRQPGAGEMLQAFLLLSVVAFVLSLLWRPAVPRHGVASLLVEVFCVWRVSRGGRISRMILIIASGLSYVSAVLAVARSWDLLIAAGPGSRLKATRGHRRDQDAVAQLEEAIGWARWRP